MKYKKLSSVEYEFMEFAWSRNTALVFQDFKKHFVDEQGKSWARETLSTVLHNIVKKGFLKAYRKEKVFFYEPAISQLDYQRYLLNEQLNSKIGNSVESLVAAFCGISNASDTELEQINQYLTEIGERMSHSEQ